MSLSTVLIGLWFFLWGAATLPLFTVDVKLLAAVALAVPLAIVLERLTGFKIPLRRQSAPTDEV
jgi:hypothetical protein